ncbi:hypothetical protein BDY19DRAFT_946906 [Irpex rosettiformis]|uniref:Uncharacterized protein n=1 Tax=Irpex rosettiformis TaxID=378272 RepID=A0ACB8U3X7_9APHY|nr:hypothetical protein BDY19DRAFT_946906 [Irpex rosettiformis]
MLCPNLHCLETECFAHTYSTGWCPSSTQEDVNTNEAMLAKVKRAPCGDSCFLDLHTPEIQNSIDWESEPEVEALDAILQLSPNTLPCSLITLVPQTQCYKIFARRSRIIQGSEPKESEARSSENRAPLFFNDVDVAVKATTFVMYVDLPQTFASHAEILRPVRCAHKGDCGPTSVPKCECYTNGVHCRRNCQCSQRCVRRYKGCRCARGMHLCAPGKRSCMCRIMGRECDPEVCKHSLPAKGNKGKAVRKVHPKCSNFEFQRSSPVCLVVRAGRYGLGTFAGQTIHRDAFLGTYIGETFWTEDDELRKPESTYNGLNYMFAHTSTQYIDAQSAGNETRYINHASKEMANVAAEFRLVNGEQQIGFFATKTIKPNQELFFDYGPAYWSRG